MVENKNWTPICDNCVPKLLKELESQYSCKLKLINHPRRTSYQNIYVVVDPDLAHIVGRLNTTLYVFDDQDKVDQRLTVWGDEAIELQWLELFYAMSDSDFEFIRKPVCLFASSAKEGMYELSGDLTTIGYNVQKLFENLKLFQKLRELHKFLKDLEEKGLLI